MDTSEDNPIDPSESEEDAEELDNLADVDNVREEEDMTAAASNAIPEDSPAAAASHGLTPTSPTPHDPRAGKPRTSQPRKKAKSGVSLQTIQEMLKVQSDAFIDIMKQTNSRLDSLIAKLDAPAGRSPP
jgi:hypothetical protein